ncbi:MAG TPA: class II aldolase family protein [Clostridiales bacterium]|jgi:L-fuculose-phosphate aldolase|nr:class II aldolase family protein [Clostridiales bacterium]
MTYPNVEDSKKMICEIGRRMYQREYVAANDGNISVKVGENLIISTPTGVSKGYMTPDMISEVDLEGNWGGIGLEPTSELKMHLRVYKENKNVGSVVHAHPPIATAFSVAGIELVKPILIENVLMVGPILIAPFAKPGTQEVPESIAPYCKKYKGVLLANHGALTWGKDLTEAYHRLESMEHYAKILMYSTKILGSNRELDSEQIERLID